jgi:hypothetical protein
MSNESTNLYIDSLSTIFIAQRLNFKIGLYTPTSQIKSTSKVILSQTIKRLTEFIRKIIYVYNIKLVSLDTS